MKGSDTQHLRNRKYEHDYHILTVVALKYIITYKYKIEANFAR